MYMYLHVRDKLTCTCIHVKEVNHNIIYHKFYYMHVHVHVKLQLQVQVYVHVHVYHTLHVPCTWYNPNKEVLHQLNNMTTTNTCIHVIHNVPAHMHKKRLYSTKTK